MKKLNLNRNTFAAGETLTREQLKKVMGGGGMETGIEVTTGPGDDFTTGEYGDSPKVAACRSKKQGDDCIFDYNGTPYNGRCQSHMASELYCSTLI